MRFYHVLIGPVEMQEPDGFSNALRDFVTSYRESKFLFESSSGIFPLLEEFHAKAFKVIGFKKHGAEIAQGDPDLFQKVNSEFQDALDFFPKALEILERSIAPYLNFQRVLA